MKKVKQSIFNYYKHVIYHMPEDHQYALGDTLRDEYDEATLDATLSCDLEGEIHSLIMKKLDEIEALL